MNLKGILVSYKRTCQNFGCREAQGQKLSCGRGNSSVQAGKGQSLGWEFLHSYSHCDSYESQNFSFFLFACFPPHFCSTAWWAGRKFQQCFSMSATVTQGCACSTNPREQRVQRRCRNNKIIWKRLICHQRSPSTDPGGAVSPECLAPDTHWNIILPEQRICILHFKLVVLSSLTGQAMNYSSTNNTIWKGISLYVERRMVNLPIFY